MKSIQPFNPQRVAYFEKAGWEAYYDRKWLQVFRLMVALNQEQFQMSLWTSTLASLNIVKASLAFAPVDNDIPGATSQLRHYYEMARRSAQIQPSASELARLEMDYWVEHRRLAMERKADPELDNLEPLVESLTRLHMALFAISEDQARRSAKLRAQAARAVDRITGRYSKNVAEDWRKVEEYLVQAYQTVLAS